LSALFASQALERSEEMRKSQAGIECEDAKSSNDPLKLEYEDYLRNQRGLCAH
jgi:hypothetical protein